MIAQHLDCCAICRAKPDEKRLAVDHDKETGRVRGLLCAMHNKGLGHFSHNPQLLRAAASYIERANKSTNGRSPSPEDPAAV